MSAERVLHIVPSSVREVATGHLGGTKAILAINTYFRDRGIEYTELSVPKRTDKALLALLKTTDLQQYSVVIIEFTTFVASVRFIRRQKPDMRILVRSINAELYHWLDHAVAWLRLGHPLRAGRRAAIALHKFWCDWRIARVSDAILAITDWEHLHYWRLLSDKRKVHTIPYFVVLDEDGARAPDLPKQNICLCLIATGASPLLLNEAGNFVTAVSTLDARMPEWSFQITGDALAVSLPERIERIGFVENLPALLGRVRAVAALADYGYGFKTRILEAICFGCTVLVTKRLIARIPVEMQPFCRVVDPSSAESIEAALRSCTGTVRTGVAVNEMIKARAYKTLDGLIELKAMEVRRDGVPRAVEVSAP